MHMHTLILCWFMQKRRILFKRGGILAWGLVPTSEAIENEEISSLQEKFVNGIERLSKRGLRRIC